jgi:hypothetical protein
MFLYLSISEQSVDQVVLSGFYVFEDIDEAYLTKDPIGLAYGVVKVST